jgi:hypothetical protein
MTIRIPAIYAASAAHGQNRGAAAQNALLATKTQMRNEMKWKLSTLAMAAVALSACAKRPDAIAPVAYPIQAYGNSNCQQLASEYATEKKVLAEQSTAQNQAANGDAMGVFLIGVPTSSLTGGDQEGKISVTKGKILAIEAALASKGCKA